MLQDILKSKVSRIFILSWTGVAAIHYVQFSLQYTTKGMQFPWFTTLLEFVINYYVWIPLALLIIHLAKRFPMEKERFAASLALHFMASLFIAAFHIGIIAANLKVFKAFEFEQSSFSYFYKFVFLQLFHFECLLYWVVLGLSMALKKSEPGAIASPDNQFLQKISLKENGRTIILDIPKVERLEAADNYVKIYTPSDSYLVRERLSSLESKLNPGCFQRIHRSAIVNLSQIREIRREHSRYTAVLKSGKTLPISRRRYNGLQNWLTSSTGIS